jgi:hypothetical protein
MGILLGSRSLRWTMPGMVLGDVASQRRLYLAAKPSHVGVDVDGLACPLHRPIVCSSQTKGYGFLSGATLSCHAIVGSGAFPVDAKPTSVDIGWRVDRLGTCLNQIFTRSRLFLPGHAYPMLEPSWHLCVYPWLSYYVRR